MGHVSVFALLISYSAIASPPWSSIILDCDGMHVRLSRDLMGIDFLDIPSMFYYGSQVKSHAGVKHYDPLDVKLRTSGDRYELDMPGRPVTQCEVAS